MKQYVTWTCDRCGAVFEFETGIAPLRCPDCCSPKEHLHYVADVSDIAGVQTRDAHASSPEGSKNAQ